MYHPAAYLQKEELWKKKNSGVKISKNNNPRPLFCLVPLVLKTSVIECQRCNMSGSNPVPSPGDKVIPDLSYLDTISKKIRAVLLTHGHADHIGGLRYVLEKVKVPVYGTELTIGLADEVLPGSVRPVDFRTVQFGKHYFIAGVRTEFIRVNHSIPDGAAIALHFPAGIVLHTGDFKIDLNPIDGNPMDLQRLGDLGLKGILCLMADSTNADEPGYTASESTVEPLNNCTSLLLADCCGHFCHKHSQAPADCRYNSKIWTQAHHRWKEHC